MSISCVEDVEDEELEEVLESSRGCHSKITSLLNDEEFRLAASKCVCQNGYKKGEPNLTLAKFCKWVEDERGIKICERTACS